MTRYVNVHPAEEVNLYEYPNRPTNPREITHDTPLESLNLNWSEKQLPEKERTKHVHRLHPYLGKFIPQLVEVFLRKYFSPGQTVLDPFCGSGTTLVQANELEINSIGYDVSAFNVLLCRAKTAQYDLSKLSLEVNDILNKTGAVTKGHGQQRNLFGEEFPLPSISETDSDYLRAWYSPRSLRELLTYRRLIEDGDYEYADILKIILSRSARSARLTTHFDLDFPKKPQTEPYHCYKHSRECYPTSEAFKFLRRYSIDTLRRVKAFADVRTAAKVEIHHADSRDATFLPINGVITSPPYVGLIDYHEQHVYGYHLLGLEDNRVSEIGPAVNGSSQAAKQQYQKDIAEVFRRASDAMPIDGRMVVVAHDKSDLYGEIASTVGGIDVEAILNRQVNRRTGRRSSEFYESIFIWRKFE